jgi:phage-related tail fiber protein
MQVSDQDLFAAARECLLLSMNGALSPADQDAFLEKGQQLRTQRTILAGHEFTQDVHRQWVQDANTRLAQVNAALAVAAQNIQNTIAAVAAVGSLVAVLDRLVKAMAGAVAGG